MREKAAIKCLCRRQNFDGAGGVGAFRPRRNFDVDTNILLAALSHIYYLSFAYVLGALKRSKLPMEEWGELKKFSNIFFVNRGENFLLYIFLYRGVFPNFVFLCVQRGVVISLNNNIVLSISKNLRALQIHRQQLVPLLLEPARQLLEAADWEDLK